MLAIANFFMNILRLDKLLHFILGSSKIIFVSILSTIFLYCKIKN